jgi:hypothetical protein
MAAYLESAEPSMDYSSTEEDLKKEDYDGEKSSMNTRDGTPLLNRKNSFVDIITTATRR